MSHYLIEMEKIPSNISVAQWYDSSKKHADFCCFGGRKMGDELYLRALFVNVYKMAQYQNMADKESASLC